MLVVLINEGVMGAGGLTVAAGQLPLDGRPRRAVAVRRASDLGRRRVRCKMGAPNVTVRAPEGERRSLESMVFGIKLPNWEGLGVVVMRCARIVLLWVQGI